ncbi:hypothetical protein [Reyranella sp.]|jgi:hypothetical protein|uniref:hypothetical protein n=1 Tax=Reyranella sp. TaxID=1929291 RepID=UPI002F92799C
MEIVRQGSRHVLPAIAHASAVAVCLFASVAAADVIRAEPVAWKLEPDGKPASYAVVEPSRTNMNIADVVLACESAGERSVLQLQIYLTGDGPLLPRGIPASKLKDEPRAEISIDGKIFPVSLLFGDDHAVLADHQVDGFAGLSDELVDAMAKGRTMTLRLDLVAEPPGTAAAFDGEAVIDLQAGNGGAAVDAVRRCVAPARDRTVGLDGQAAPPQ